MDAEQKFYHPYEPYSIQLDFMRALYGVIEDGCVGIFESPTGTGKSLSLICGSLTWLRKHKRNQLEGDISKFDIGDDEPAWVLEHAREEHRENALRARRELERRLEEAREREKKDKEAYLKVADNEKRLWKRQKSSETMRRGTATAQETEAQFDLDEYLDDNNNSNVASDGLTKETRDLLARHQKSYNSKEEEDNDTDEIKIIFCSRTHSQLAQFVNELRRVKFPPTFGTSEISVSTEPDQPVEKVKHVPLGSRKLLCINSDVNTPEASATTVNERCLDLQDPSISKAKKCPFIVSKADTDKVILAREFRDMVLADVRDIEDVKGIGSKIGVCGYYALRDGAMGSSEIVTLPYPLLLQKSARAAMNINLKDHVVIIDEAHNLMDAVSSIHSVTLSLSQLTRCEEHLTAYLAKFGKKLKGGNKVFVDQCLRLVEVLKIWLERKYKAGKAQGVVTQGELLRQRNIDQIDIHALGKYLETSKLARKIQGYVLFKDEQQLEGKLGSSSKQLNVQKKKSVASGLPVLSHVYSFLLTLTNTEDEGKVFYGPMDDGEEYGYKYMLLDPSYHFKDIVEEARAVILAGGTMEPIDDYINHLFPYLPSEKIRTISCGHVIPKENMLATVVHKGSTGQTFEFNYERRNDSGMIHDLGRSIINLCLAIPHGVVVFFPSYNYLDVVIGHWQMKGPNGSLSIWDKLAQRKSLFKEAKGSSSVDEMLQEYAAAVDTGKGALLLSVVGGKMSEGINFSDNLGRGVIMVGLPFPNSQTAEWKAKLEHVEKTAKMRASLNGSGSGSEASNVSSRDRWKQASREFYENACMRAVNQSVGRAIRHRQDYAAIILMDRRFGNRNIWNKLPKWIREGNAGSSTADPTGSSGSGNLAIEERNFIDVMRSVGQFFKAKKMTT